jgi:hypothetical protein
MLISFSCQPLSDIGTHLSTGELKKMKINLKPDDILIHRLSVRVTDRAYTYIAEQAKKENRSVADIVRIWINQKMGEKKG